MSHPLPMCHFFIELYVLLLSLVFSQKEWMLFQSLLCKSCLSLRDVWQSPCRCRHDPPCSPICSSFEVYGFSTRRASLLGCVWHSSSGLRQLGISTPLALKTRFCSPSAEPSKSGLTVCACPTSRNHRAVPRHFCHHL